METTKNIIAVLESNRSVKGKLKLLIDNQVHKSIITHSFNAVKNKLHEISKAAAIFKQAIAILPMLPILRENSVISITVNSGKLKVKINI